MTTIKGQTETTTVAGKTYEIWADFIKRGSFAKDENGVEKQISYSGYISNDLTIRKAIQRTYGLDTFRK